MYSNRNVIIDESGKQSLAGMALWGLITAGLSVVGLVISFIRPNSFSYGNGSSFTIVITAAVQLLLLILMVMFGFRVRKGLAANNPSEINSGINSLKIYFAIITVLILLFVLIMVFVLLIGFASKGI